MRLPRSLVIQGERWRVRLTDLPNDRWGECSYDSREIRISRDLPVEERGEVLLHEILHACLPESWAPKTEERMVERLAPRLLDALRSLRWR